MTLAQTALRAGNTAATAAVVLFAGVALYMWLQAILAWGTPGPFASAMLWTAIFSVVLGANMGVERIAAGG